VDSLRERLNLNRDYGAFQGLGLHVSPLSDARIYSAFSSAIFAFDLPCKLAWLARDIFSQLGMISCSCMICTASYADHGVPSPDFLDFGVPECLRVLLKQNGLPLIMWPACSRAQFKFCARIV
jgi:hypothetical protein